MDEFTKSINIFVNSNGEGSTPSEGQSKEAKKEEKKKDDFRKRLGEAFVQQMKNIGNTIKDSFNKQMKELANAIVDITKDAWNELSEMASYNLSKSLFQTSRQREKALQYGLSDSQNYAMTKSMDFLGLENEDDLVYMNDKQRDMFFKQMDKWTAFYEEAEQSGLFENIEEMQVEFKEFKDEIMIDIAEFFIENKDEIKNGIKLIVSALKALVQIVGAIAQLLHTNVDAMSDSDRAAKTSDIISHYSTSNQKNVNIKVDNTFNGIDTKNQSTLLNAGEFTYKQIIEAMK